MNEGKKCRVDPYKGHRVCCEKNLAGDEACLAEDEYNIKKDTPWYLCIIAFLFGVFSLAVIPWLVL